MIVLGVILPRLRRSQAKTQEREESVLEAPRAPVAPKVVLPKIAKKTSPSPSTIERDLQKPEILPVEEDSFETETSADLKEWVYHYEILSAPLALRKPDELHHL